MESNVKGQRSTHVIVQNGHQISFNLNPWCTVSIDSFLEVNGPIGFIIQLNVEFYFLYDIVSYLFVLYYFLFI